MITTRSRESGFSLVELMIVLGVLGILSGLYVLNVQFAVQETRAVACEKNRVLFEEQEKLFFHREGRPSLALSELVDEKYLTKTTCPRGGVLTWEVTDPALVYAHQSLVCSIHGPKTRINAWKVAATSEEAGSAYAYSDGFDDDIATAWTQAKGKYWEVVDGVYRAGRATGKSGEHRSFSGDEEWTDYTLTAQATLHRGQGYGIYFRATDPSAVDGYLFQYAPGAGKGQFQIRRVTDGKPKKVLAKVNAPAGYDWYGSERAIRIDVSGETFTAYIDGEEVLSASDGTYGTGGVGLRTWGKGMVDFDDIQVELSGE